MSAHTHDKTVYYDPSPFSAQRLTTLIASLGVALGAGTGYAYSAYAPQLGNRLNISHTQLNIIGLSIGVGAYSTGPIWGWLVDSRGPRPPFVLAFLSLFIGYIGTRFVYDSGLSSNEKTLPMISFLFLVLCGFLSGAGGNAGTASAINSTAKTFPDSARATTVGFVLSGVGLSAFFFSTIARVFFPGDTSHFLLILALGTTIPMVIGFFLVRPIPLPRSTSRPTSLADQDRMRRTSISDAVGAPLLQDDDLQEREGEESMPLGTEDGIDMGEDQQRPDSRGRYMSRRRALLMGDATLTNMFGKRLAKSQDFWLLFVIFSLLTGTGVMYINNVGSMSQALYAKESAAYEDIEAQKWQTTQVSAISIMNCAGRILIGLICDYGKSKLGIPRSTSLVLVSSLFFLSQVAAASVEHVKSLWVASSLLGLSYGSVFSLFATMCVEWFGMPHFAENWGYLVTAPIFAGNVFSLIFGRNLDAHDPEQKHVAARGGSGQLPSAPRCLLGRACYVDTVYLTMGACLFAVGLSLWACWRDREKMREAAKVARTPSDSQ